VSIRYKLDGNGQHGESKQAAENDSFEHADISYSCCVQWWDLPEAIARPG
jgi:hypothetical protein